MLALLIVNLPMSTHATVLHTKNGYDISRSFKQVSLTDDFAQMAWENWKLLQFSIELLKSLSKKCVNLKKKVMTFFYISPLKQYVNPSLFKTRVLIPGFAVYFRYILMVLQATL